MVHHFARPLRHFRNGVWTGIWRFWGGQTPWFCDSCPLNPSHWDKAFKRHVHMLYWTTLQMLQVPVTHWPFQAHLLPKVDQQTVEFCNEGRLCTNMVTHMQTGLRPLSCHHQSLACPKSRLTHSKCKLCCLNLLDSLQLILDFGAVTTMVGIAPSHDPAGHLWADLGLQSCHHQSLVCPKSPLTHQPGSQQMPAQLLESAGHPSADLGLSRPDVTIRSPPEQNNANVVPSVTSFASKTIAARWSPSTSPAACRDTVGSNVWLSAATSLKKPHWQDFCARSLKSPTLEDCGSENAHCSRLAKLQWLKVCVKKYRPVSSSFYEWLILSQIASNCTTLGYVSWIFFERLHLMFNTLAVPESDP